MKNEIVQTDVLTEDQMLEQLGIPDWRHMSKDRVMSFVSNIHKMDPAVAKEAIKQFPNFGKLGNDIISSLRLSLEETTKDGRKGADNVYKINSRILDSLEKELNRPFLFPARRCEIIDKMLVVSDNIERFENGQRESAKRMLDRLAAVGVLALGLGATILGIDIYKK